MNRQSNEFALDEASQATPFYVDTLLAEARKTTGLSDFGDEGFIEGLTLLTTSLREEGQLHEGGKVGQSQEIIRLLANRLRYVNDVKRYPEILEEKIEAPIIVVGLPRTGTSKLQRVMSANPDVQRLEVWRLLNPAPYPGEDPNNPVERIEFAKAVEEVFRTQFPGWMARHPMEAQEPDEELFIMEMSFECAVSAMLARAPTFRKFATRCDPKPTYQLLFQMLQYMQWQDGGSRGRPWIMKSPVHVGYMDTLFEFFPDATVIHCHREPIKTVPSFASTIYELRKTTTDQLDAAEIGEEWFNYWATLTDQYLAVRDKLPLNQVVNATFEDICRNPLSVVEAAYQKAGRKLTATAIASCKDYDSRRPVNHWGAYDYTLEEFSLSESDINERFKAYRTLFC